MRVIRPVLIVLTLGFIPHMLSAQATAALFGNIVDDRGSPLPGVNVTLQNAGSFVSDAVGRFRFFGLTQGNYTISASLDGYTSVSFSRNIPSGNSDWTLTLTPAVSSIVTVDGARPAKPKPVAVVKPKTATPKPAAPKRPAQKNPPKPTSTAPAAQHPKTTSN